jgi:hypothetical protein
MHICKLINLIKLSLSYSENEVNMLKKLIITIAWKAMERPL